ncbi:hypothetical protein PAPYR_6211 [Paratrimastix pyriformis]|uniref:Uncharacterized protein n=1 Tax=Paratrimastix pyriformis TaxID=342808 RepID=A0ABQ8UFQ0_9EUKA|nr:hypothetical protein PAPYR_6211 [Paratrimastix pyriformis]
MTSRKISRKTPVSATVCDLWERLPPELLQIMVATSSSPLQTYIQLLGLSHTIRARIRGTLHELSFDEPDSVLLEPDDSETLLSGSIIPTTDALTALVGPCKALRKLSFPKRLARTEADSADWVDEAFGGHDQLAVVTQFPELPECDVERSFCHLPGLVELTVSSNLTMSARLLRALARSCSGLQVLQCTLSGSYTNSDLTALAPLLGVLKRLDLGDRTNTSGENLTAIVRELSAVTSLRLPWCPPDALKPIASHLTSFRLCYFLGEKEELPGPGLCRLETLQLLMCCRPSVAPLVQLLTANQATLRCLTLQISLEPLLTESLMASLRALPHLTSLNLKMGREDSPLSVLLPPDLVDRLECLEIRHDATECDPVRITSRRLQRLVFTAQAFKLALHCPALVELELARMEYGQLTSMQCPRLRTIRVPWSLDGAAAMPDLEVVEPPRFGRSEALCWSDPVWLLSPRLRALSHVRLSRSDLLTRLCACGSLVRLEELHLDVTRLPNPLVLRLPGQLEHLDMHIERTGCPEEERRPPPPIDLQVVAPGLVNFSLANTHYHLQPSVRVLLHNCPALARLALKSSAALLSFRVEEGENAGSPIMQPRSLSVDDHLEVASLLGLLTRHGARLRNLSAPEGFRDMTSEDWPQLMGALSGLPRLTDLELNVFGALSPISLACPQLRTLIFCELSDDAKVLLACPLLARLSGVELPSQLKLVLPAPGLDSLYDPFRKRPKGLCLVSLLRETGLWKDSRCNREEFSMPRQQPVRVSMSSRKMPRAIVSTTADDLWERLPLELLLIIVEKSPNPLRTYIQLLSLSHVTRASIRGTLCELSFLEPDRVLPEPLRPTTDALAALVGPCKALSKLSFPEWWAPDTRRGVTPASDWVDEAFGGHAQLAVLSQFPELPECDAPRIFRHLPGLVELSSNFTMSARLLGALARSCSGLQVLQCTVPDDVTPRDLVTALTPLFGVIKQLDLAGSPWPNSLAALVRKLAVVTSLWLPCCPPDALKPIASHLTSFQLSDFLDEEELPGPWLCRLETLRLLMYRPQLAPLTQLLAANQATLRCLTLEIELEPLTAESLMASLRALPHLTSLNLAMGCDSDSPLSVLLPPDLVDRLECLEIRHNRTESDPVRITSRRLQRLVLAAAASRLELHCPALVELYLIEMPHCQLTSMQCPRLRTIRVPAQSLDGAAAMPDLEVVEFPDCDGEVTPFWTDPDMLLTGSPRLRELSHVRLSRPDMLTKLGACGSLVRLNDLHLDVTRIPNPLVLRLPGKLEHLDMHIERVGCPEEEERPPPPIDLQVVAPGLVNFSLSVVQYNTQPSFRVRLLNCPALDRLSFKTAVATLSFQVEEMGPPVMQPRSISIEGGLLGVASLLSLLTRHGARLRKLSAPEGFRDMASEDWPQLMGALSGLPRLTDLELNVFGAPSPISLTCPQLRTLSFRELCDDDAKVVLACPVLAQLSGVDHPSRQLELVLPAPGLAPLYDVEDEDDNDDDDDNGDEGAGKVPNKPKRPLGSPDSRGGGTSSPKRDFRWNQESRKRDHLDVDRLD